MNRRNRQRGAALVESALVITTLVTFFGLVIYSRNAYAEKLDAQTTTRRDSLDFASHSCERNRGNAILSGAAEGVEPPPGDAALDKSPQRRALDTEFNMASATADVTVRGVYSVDRSAYTGGGINLQKTPIARRIHAESHVACNEKRYDNPWTQLIQFAVDWAKTGGGIPGGPGPGPL